MKPEPLWRKINKRPSWERGEPVRWSDVNPAAPLHIAVNRARLTIGRTTSRMADVLDRLEAIERERAERERAARRRAP